jgi:hypothetical protein
MHTWKYREKNDFICEMNEKNEECSMPNDNRERRNGATCACILVYMSSSDNGN